MCVCGRPCSDVLGEFMEARGAGIPGILTLTTGLSKPFMRLDKYPTLLKELERHMEVRTQTCHVAPVWWGSRRNLLLCPSAGESPWPARHPQVHGLLQKPVGEQLLTACWRLLTSSLLRPAGANELPWPCLLATHQTQCQEVRKRKELELQILTESIRLWEGDDIKTLGSVLYMSQVLVQSPGSEVLDKRTHPSPRGARG